LSEAKPIIDVAAVTRLWTTLAPISTALNLSFCPIPAKAGIHPSASSQAGKWIPASAGVAAFWMSPAQIAQFGQNRL
jgi:hypothetical protein